MLQPGATLCLPDGRTALLHTEDDRPVPGGLVVADDATSAKRALSLLRSGSDLLWTGDWHQGRRLLSALRRRIKRPRSDGAATGEGQAGLAAAWRAERAHVRAVAEVVGRVHVVVEADGRVPLPRAQDTREAVAWGIGLADGPRLVPLATVVGLLGAAGWQRRGVEVPGLEGRIHPRFGVFPPTRHAYVGLLEHVRWAGRTVLDTGCGTGVLGFVALQRGARRVWAVDTEPRAVACALDNGHRLGLADRYEAAVADLWWPAAGGTSAGPVVAGPVGAGRVDVAVFNPPWLPEPPRTRLDRAVFDEGGVVRRWLAGLDHHLADGGEGCLLVSDLAVRLGLRDDRELPAWIEAAGLRTVAVHDAPAGHKRARDRRDPLHVARVAERVQAWVIARG